jgi:protein-tyrosine-phosphatase
LVEDTMSGVKSEPTTYNLLFVCTGNTCRSPMAVEIARRALEERGWSHVAVRSAGIAAGQGAPASPHALAVAAEQGLDLSRHSATQLTPELVDWADLVLVMGGSHFAAIEELGGGEKVALITEFAEGDAAGAPVEDPYGGDEESYRRVFFQLEQAIAGVLVRLEPILSP